jgi:AcrR family transcriptional regulator
MLRNICFDFKGPNPIGAVYHLAAGATLTTIRDPAARQRIVEIAARVVAESGVRGATIRAIATAGGVTTGYITHYFVDKQALISEVIRHTNLNAERRVRQAIADAGGGIAALEAAIEVMLPLDAGRLQEWRVWTAVWREPSLGDEYSAGYRTGWDGLRNIFSALLDAAVTSGDLDPATEVEFEAERLVTMLAGAGLLAGVQEPERARAVTSRMLKEQVRALIGPCA